MKPQGVLLRSKTPPSANPRSASTPPSLEAAAPFRLTRRLNPSGTFNLFRAAARHNHGPGCYLLKSPRPQTHSPSLDAARLGREALVAASIRHAALKPILAADVHSPDPYLLLPYRDGISLRQLLAAASRDHAPLSVPRALSIARQTAAALAALHAAGWLHNQVRPQHILLSPQGQVTLLDLTVASRTEAPECFATAEMPCLPQYAAPETNLRGSRLTPAADSYSLGIVLYEMLAGQPPFQTATAQEMLRHHRQTAIPDIRQFRPDISPELAHLIRLLLAKDPLRRPTDSDLLRYLTNLEIAALSVGQASCLP